MLRIFLAMVFSSLILASNLALANQNEVKVGIYKGETYGAVGIYDTLKEIPNFHPEYFTRIDKENLLRFDVVIIPATGYYIIKEKERLALNAYAYSGYGVLLSSYSVGGWRDRFKVFPEIATATGRVDNRTILVTDKRHPVTKGMDKIIHSYYDHIILKPGPLGRVLANDDSGIHPEIIAGVVGNKGKVLCVGNAFGIASDNSDIKVEGTEKKLLVQGIAWLAKDTPKDSSSYSEWEELSVLRLKIEETCLENYHTICKLWYELGTELDGAGYDLEIFELKEKSIESKVRLLQKKLENAVNNLKDENHRFTERIIKKSFNLIQSKEIQSIQKQVNEHNEEIVEKVKNIEKQFAPEIKSLVEEVNLLTKERAKEPVPRESDWFSKDRFIRIFSYHGYFRKPDYVTKALKWLNTTVLQTYYFQHVWSGDRSIDVEKELYELSKRYNLPIIPGAADYGKIDWFNSAEFKQSIEKEYNTWGKYPGFAGVELDEPTITDKDVRNEEGYKRFREYLRNKYSSSKLKELGIINLESTIPPEKQEESPVLWTELQYFKIELMVNYLKEIEDYLKSIRPDLVFLPPIMQLLPTTPQLSSYPAIGSQLSCIAMDPYNNANLDEAFLFDLIKSNAKGPALHVIAPSYDESPYTYARDLIISLAHADGIWDWNWLYQSKYRNPYFWEDEGGKNAYSGWKEGMWEETVKAFSKMEKVERYLVNTQAVSEIALIFSERTAIIDSYNKNYQSQQYYPNLMSWYQALTVNHIQCVPEFAESLNEEKLKRYKLILLPDARCLSEKEIKLLKDWVEKGGVLIATGSSSLYDEWGRKREDYALRELFGVSYKGSAKENKNFNYQGLTITYDKERAFDTIQPEKAEVVGRWQNGEPAVTKNKCGRGKVIFISANKLGLCYEGCSYKGIESQLCKEYFPGVREFIARIVCEALKERESFLPFEVSSCPEMVEVIMKKQPGRYILHFTNYGYKHPVRNVGIEVIVPSAGKAKVFYPEDNQRIRIRKGPEKIGFKIRDFDVHEVVVIEH